MTRIKSAPENQRVLVFPADNPPAAEAVGGICAAKFPPTRQGEPCNLCVSPSENRVYRHFGTGFTDDTDGFCAGRIKAL